MCDRSPHRPHASAQAICQIFEVHMATASLLHSGSVWICNAVGLPASMGCKREWAGALCPWVLLPPHPMTIAVNDMGADARFAGNQYHAMGITAFLSAPLVASNGHRVGAVCFNDMKPRK